MNNIMNYIYNIFSCFCCHSPHGECGLKSVNPGKRISSKKGHSPHGECGLKFSNFEELKRLLKVTLHTESVD